MAINHLLVPRRHYHLPPSSSPTVGLEPFILIHVMSTGACIPQTSLPVKKKKKGGKKPAGFGQYNLAQIYKCIMFFSEFWGIVMQKTKEDLVASDIAFSYPTKGTDYNYYRRCQSNGLCFDSYVGLITAPGGIFRPTPQCLCIC